MKKEIKVLLVVSCLSLIVSLVIGCGQGTSGGGATETATITGQVAVASSDLVAAGVSSFNIVPPKFRTLANTGLSDAEVKLYQIASNGTVTDTGKSTTSDSNGNYTFTDVPVITNGIYKVVASTEGGSDQLEVDTLAVVDSAGTKTANLGPETTAATYLFDKEIKDKYSKVNVDENALKDAFDITTDDIEKLVQTQQKIDSPSNLVSKKDQMENLALGIAEEPNLNAKKAFEKIDLQNEGYNAKENASSTEGAKYINNLVLNGSGQDYLIDDKITEVLSKAYLDNKEKTFPEIVSALDQAFENTQLDESAIKTAWQSQINNTFTLIASLAAGTSDEQITDPAFFVFNEQPALSASTQLDMAQAVTLKNFVEENYASSDKFNGTKFVDSLALDTTGTGVTTSSAFFREVNIYYGSYGAWKVGGNVVVSVPDSLKTAGTTVESVALIEGGTTVATFPADTGADYSFRLSHENGPTVTPSSSGATYNYTLQATLTNGTSITTPVTLEVFELPGSKVYKLDDTEIDDSGAAIAPAGSGYFEYYSLPGVSDIKPVFVWSTSEVSSIPIPAGYSWAYAVEITLYGSNLGTHSGTSTLETDSNNDRLSLTDPQRATMEYSSTGDLGKLYTNASFMSPIDLINEYNGQKVAYRFYLQRILLNAEGKYNGIAAGNFKYLRYAP